MTQEDALKLPAGEELDKAIAQAIGGASELLYSSSGVGFLFEAADEKAWRVEIHNRASTDPLSRAWTCTIDFPVGKEPCSFGRVVAHGNAYEAATARAFLAATIACSSCTGKGV